MNDYFSQTDAVAVTGGSGFIGSHVVDKLIANGINVVVIDRNDPVYRNNQATYYKTDLLSQDLEKIFKKNNIVNVIHLAAQTAVSCSLVDPIQDAKDNILATINLLRFCKKYNVRKVIAASSAALYANPLYLPVDEKHPVGYLSPYALSKATMEKYIKLSGIDYVIFRYSNVYGPRQSIHGEAGVVAVFIDRILKKQTVEIHGDGEQIRDFLYVEDVAEINIIALKAPSKNVVVNFSTNQSNTINNLLELIKKHTNFLVDDIYVSAREGDIRKSILDNRKSVEIFGYVPQITIEEGIKKTIAHFCKECI
ncbi:UDP-glucose 4-epimerase [Alphaproteobacteria bacterium]|nr:UDP-glucose 4-epimerase [Alphaproteobacteria bacterium]